MALLKKAEVLSEAERLGISLDGLTWQQQLSTVMKAQKAEQQVGHEPIPEDAIDIPAVFDTPVPTYGRVIISPEIKPTQYQLIKYDEVLGDDVELEEKTYNINDMSQVKATRGWESGTFNIKNVNGGRKVVAQSTVPKEGAGMYFDFSLPIIVPVVTMYGRTGYLWTHQTLPSVKGLLMESGYYEEYKDAYDTNKHPDALWYSAGLIACSMSVTHAVLKQIEQQYKREH